MPAGGAPRGFDVGTAFTRLITSVPAIIQITAAALAAYSFAHWVLGHGFPFLAATVCITSLGFLRDARPRSVFDTALGITFGVAIATGSLFVIGRGLWQLALVLVVVVSIARFFHPSPAFAVSAGVQAAIVSIVPVTSGGEYTRILDAVAGGAAAVLATALVPRDSSKHAREEAALFFTTVQSAVNGMVEALRRGDEDEGLRALEELRATHAILERWGAALESAEAIAVISPYQRRQRAPLHAQEELRTALDLVVRNLRVLARRVWSLARDGKPRASLADILALLESGIAELRMSIDKPEFRARAQQTFTLAAVQLDPTELMANARIPESMVVMQCRPLVVDLLVATGLDIDAARKALPDVD